MKFSIVIGLILAIAGAFFGFFLTINPVFHILGNNGLIDEKMGILYGTLFGGVLGPVFSLTSFLLVFASFREQQKYNDRQEQFSDRQVKYSRKQIFRDQYFELIGHFRASVDWIVYVKSNSRDRSTLTGTQFFVEAKRQVEVLIHFVEKNLPKGTDPKILMSVGFSIFYYGVSKKEKATLISVIGKVVGKSIAKSLVRKLRGKKTAYSSKIVYFGGHQGKLAHYFRQLHNIIDTIENTDLYQRDDKTDEKKELAKAVRVQLTNYEQAILYYNSFTSSGESWDKLSYFVNYELIKNIPTHFVYSDPSTYYKMKYENAL